MLPTKLLILISAFVLAVSGDGITYYGTSNVRNQSRPPPHPLTLQPSSHQSQPDNGPRPVYVPPPPVAPAPPMTANPVPQYTYPSSQYQPQPAPLQPARQPAPISPQPLSSQPNLWSSGMYSRPNTSQEPERPLPPLSAPAPTTIASPSRRPEPVVIITEGPSFQPISSNNWHPQPINSDPIPQVPITPIRDTVPIEGHEIPDESGIALSPTTTTSVPEVVFVVEPENTPNPAPVETVNLPSLNQGVRPNSNPLTRQHISPISPGSNYIVTTPRPPPIFPPRNPPPRNPATVEKPNPPTYPIYPSTVEPQIPTLPPRQPQPVVSNPSEEISSPMPEPSSSIIPDLDVETESPEPSSTALPSVEEPINPSTEPPAPSPEPSYPPPEPLIPMTEPPTPSPEPYYPPPEPIIPPTEPPAPIPEPSYPPPEPIIPPIERPAPSPLPLYPTPEIPAPSTQPPVPTPAPVFPSEPTIPPIQTTPPRPAPSYPPPKPIIPPIERPAPNPLPLYPSPKPPTPSTQPPAPKPAPVYPPPHPTQPPVPPTVPTPVSPPSPNLQPLYPPSNPSNRPPAFVSQPLESKLLVGFTCSRGNGYYAIAEQCDSYVECQANQAWQIYCPDGLHFNPNSAYPNYPCAYPSEVKCAGSAAKQIAQPTNECPRRYGFFPSNDGDCSKYINCQEGKATLMNCPFGLVFNDALSSCDWPENVPQCNLNAFKDFTCPTPPLDSDGNPTDIIYKYKYGSHCKMYLACQRGHPRLLRCDSGLSFDEKSQACIDSDLVPECSMRT